MRSPGKGGMSTTTQVKVSSPEITHIALGQEAHFSEANSDTRGIGERGVAVPGFESVAGMRTVFIGTWENQSIPGSCRRRKDVIIQYAALVVGLTHSRSVNKVILIEDNEVHSKGLVVSRKKYGKKIGFSTEVDKAMRRNGLNIFSAYFYICIVLEIDLLYMLDRYKHGCRARINRYAVQGMNLKSRMWEFHKSGSVRGVGFLT